MSTLSNSLLFSSLPLNEALLKNLATIGYGAMTPIQAATLPVILNKQDVIAQAATGSGKTAAFALGLLGKICSTHRSTQALVVCPTRELAEQVAREIRTLARLIPNIKVATLCGGVPVGPQRASLEHGVHCVVGTPGRLLDHLERGTLDLRNITTFVLDEADRMLHMGFADEIAQLVAALPKTRQSLLFSATFPADIRSLSSSLQENPVLIQIAESPQEKLAISQTFYQTTEAGKPAALQALLAHFQPESTVVFCNTKIKAQELRDELNAQGYRVEALHGDLNQQEREQVLQLFANKSTAVLIATDVAARGLHINDLQAVLNYDMAHDAEVHVHRIGRTGRAGKQGLALSLVSDRDRAKLRALESYLDLPIELSPLPQVVVDATRGALRPRMITLRIEGGKKNKLRPTDILGALTSSKKLAGSQVGKIDIGDFSSLVAIAYDHYETALQLLSSDPIKGRRFKVRVLP